MNYFELFGIAPALKIDVVALKPTFFRLQKKYHPDYYGQGSEADRGEALEWSAMINKAWKIFSNADDTLKYLLECKGALPEDEKFSLPGGFLMAVMDLNELKMDGAPADTIAATAAQLMQEIYEPVQAIFDSYNDAEITDTQLQQLKLYYYQKKYIDRLLEG